MSKRLAFLILLLLNVVMFAWGYQRQLVPEPSHIPMIIMEGPGIQLLSETAKVGVKPKLEISNKVPTCVRLGPLEQQQTAAELAATIEHAGGKTDIETETTNQKSGFWVVIAVNKGQKADALMTELNGAGILDVWRFDDGPLAGMLSMGLYSDKVKAEHRCNMLIKKGFKAETKDREIEVPGYWVRVRYTAPNPTIQKVLDQLYERYPALKSLPQICHV